MVGDFKDEEGYSQKSQCLVCRVWCVVCGCRVCWVGSDLHTSLCSSVNTSARGSISAAGPLSAFFAAGVQFRRSVVSDSLQPRVEEEVKEKL